VYRFSIPDRGVILRDFEALLSITTFELYAAYRLTLKAPLPLLIWRTLLATAGLLPTLRILLSLVKMEKGSFLSRVGSSSKASPPVIVNLEKTFYVPGETISGRLVIQDVSHIQSVSISLEGKSRATVMNKRHLQGSVLLGSTGASAVPITYDQYHLFLQIPQTLFDGTSHGKGGRIESSSMDMPFSIVLPTHQQDDRFDLPLPSTFQVPLIGKRVEIFYTLEVEIKRNGLTKPNK